MKKVIAAIALMLIAATGCTPRERAVWFEWYQQDPDTATAFADDYIATASAGAVREDNAAPAQSDGPPDFSSASSNGRCVGAEPLLAYYSPGWSVSKMSAIMYRESRCDPGAYNSSGASGLLQVLKSHCGWLSGRVGACNLFNASYNIRAGAALWQNGGYQHWSQTS